MVVVNREGMVGGGESGGGDGERGVMMVICGFVVVMLMVTMIMIMVMVVMSDGDGDE